MLLQNLQEALPIKCKMKSKVHCQAMIFMGSEGFYSQTSCSPTQTIPNRHKSSSNDLNIATFSSFYRNNAFLNDEIKASRLNYPARVRGPHIRRKQEAGSIPKFSKKNHRSRKCLSS
ncbi:hypothetical protein EON65_04210 [archaeon]|nr:MAG: hypothetical protein EON65_04210 [archaeon]